MHLSTFIRLVDMAVYCIAAATSTTVSNLRGFPELFKPG